jgi:hypothetical protein
MTSMSRFDCSIVVEARHVPDDLASAVLPVEIVDPRGLVKPNQVHLVGEEVLRVSVDGPGQYVVRLELPSGEWIAASAVVPEEPDGSGHCVGRGALDFSERQAPGPRLRSWNFVQSEAPIRLSFEDLATAIALERAIALSPIPETQSDFSHAIRDGRSDWQLPVQRVSMSAAEPSLDTTQWRPTFYAFDSEIFGEYKPSDGALVVAPPFPEQRLTITRDPQPRGDGPPYLASVKVTGDASARVLFTYLRTSLTDRARTIAPDWAKQAAIYLEHKIEDPVAATQGAYVLLGLGDDRRRQWVENLAEWFEFLPDGAVIAGWHDIRRDEPERAKAWFSMALSRGIPMYSEGVRLLYQGCAYLQDLLREDAEIAGLSAIAYRLASFANLNSELTCLRLSPSDFFIEDLTVMDFPSRAIVRTARSAARRGSGIPPHRRHPREWRPASPESQPHYEALLEMGVVLEQDSLSDVELAAMAAFGRGH